MKNIIASNLQLLRISRNLTQVQVAEALGVSTHAISRWECGTTSPDVMILPKIAKLYCVTVSDLYAHNPIIYDNYAHVLKKIYSSTQKPEDFLQATREFEKLFTSGYYTENDVRCYSEIHQIMKNYCHAKIEALAEVLVSNRE